MTPPTPHPDNALRSGSLYTIGAYGLWAVLPMVLVFIEAGPWEILTIRVVFASLFCALIVTALRQWADVRRAFGSASTMGWLTLAALLMGANWLCFITASTTGRVLEASLAYFINPLMTVLLSVVVLREVMRPLQWVAIGVGVIAVVVMTVAYGTLPWLSLAMATSFALYGMVKRRLGRSVARPLRATPGMLLETLVLLPPALVVIAALFARGTLLFGTTGWVLPLLMALTGVFTAVPLILFAQGAARLPLSWLGMFQYIAPIGQFLIGWAALGEPMPAARWAGFGIVWVAVLVFVTDAALRLRSRPD